jgi:photosystem II stability/assembly factor-like uncharacterized protein
LSLVTFVDADHGFIAGSGVFLRTENGGKEWQVIRGALKANTIDYDPNSPTFHLAISQLTVQTMQFINKKKGWLGVNEGRILYTTDGGLTWRMNQTGVTEKPIMDVHFINALEGWAIAPRTDNSSLILHTVNGGASWRILFRTNQAGIALHFADGFDTGLDTPSALDPSRTQPKALSGWMVMGNGASLITHDSGVTWKQRESNFTGQIKQIEFRNHNQAFGLDSDGAVLMTYNQGESWIRHDVFLGGMLTNSHFVADQYAWAVGKSGYIHHSADGGKTWERQLSERRDDLRDALFLSDTRGWVSGDNGLLLETQDGGQTWRTLPTETPQMLIGVHFADLEQKWGWGMRRDGTVLYTTDGEKWSVGKPPLHPIRVADGTIVPFVMNDVAFGKFSEGWAVGKHGQIIHNQDGSPIWKAQHTNTENELIGLEMKFAPVGWAVGENGTVLRTINGGASWKQHKTHTGYDLHAVSFITKQSGWIAGSQGIILRTTDGGFQWEVISSGVTTELYGILALSEQEIYAVGAEGTILHSVDGGMTWRQQPTGIDNEFYTIVRAKDDDTLWVVGQWGVVLRRNLFRTSL